MIGMIHSALDAARRMAHSVVPPGSSPESYRRVVRALQKRLVYDARTHTVTVQRGELAGAKKYGPFCEADFPFALGKYEPEVTAAFRRYCRTGMTVFDIGANAGHHLLPLAKLCGASGHVHAFEPVPGNVSCLLETLRLNHLENVTVHPLAVSDHEGDAELRFAGVFDGFACLVEGGHGRSGQKTTPATSIAVKTVDLDTFCIRSAISRVDLIKMDIEGAEMLALRGMSRILRAHRPVLILELWGSDHVEQGPKLLREWGYETWRLSAWRGLVGKRFAETSNVLALPIPAQRQGPAGETRGIEAAISRELARSWD
jgi:FkbM family methyltransferase